MLALQQLYDLYGTQVDFYFVTNDDPKRVANFLKKENYKLPVYFHGLPAVSASEGMTIDNNGKISGLS